MRNSIETVGVTALLLGFASAGTFAQSTGNKQQTPQQQQKEQAQQQKEQAKRDADADKSAAKDQASLQRDLEQAQRELERAARQVAQLSGQITQPFVRDFSRQFRYRGQRAMLGFVTEDVERGVRVASVTPNGPAAQAGLKIGDTITEIDGAHLADTRTTGAGKQSPTELLLAQMENVDPGESVKLHVVSEAGAERDVTVKSRSVATNVWVNPATPAPPAPPGSYSYSFRGPGNFWFFGPNPWADMQLVALTSGLGSYFGTTKGLLVVRAPEDATLQLKDGDVILDIGGREPTSPEHAVRILGSFQKGEPLKITIMRNKSKQTLDVKLPTEAPG
jgi:C-terminal processing protease CtpA/Prc